MGVRAATGLKHTKKTKQTIQSKHLDQMEHYPPPFLGLQRLFYRIPSLTSMTFWACPSGARKTAEARHFTDRLTGNPPRHTSHRPRLSYLRRPPNRHPLPASAPPLTSKPFFGRTCECERNGTFTKKKQEHPPRTTIDMGGYSPAVAEVAARMV